MAGRLSLMSVSLTVIDTEKRILLSKETHSACIPGIVHFPTKILERIGGRFNVSIIIRLKHVKVCCQSTHALGLKNIFGARPLSQNYICLGSRRSSPALNVA